MLVHCHAGKGRTAIIIAAYLIWSNLATSAEDAINKLRKVRPKTFSGHSAKPKKDFVQNFH